MVQFFFRSQPEPAPNLARIGLPIAETRNSAIAALVTELCHSAPLAELREEYIC
jgi:hypothetical protein